MLTLIIYLHTIGACYTLGTLVYDDRFIDPEFTKLPLWLKVIAVIIVLSSWPYHLGNRK